MAITADCRLNTRFYTSLPDDHSELEPPDPIPNSVVKRLSADGSVGSPHVRVGHCQASIAKPSWETSWAFLFMTMTYPWGIRP